MRTLAPKRRVVFARWKIHALTGICGLSVISFGLSVISYQLSMPLKSRSSLLPRMQEVELASRFSLSSYRDKKASVDDPPTVSSRNSSSWGVVQAVESVAKLPSTVGINMHGGTSSSASSSSSSSSPVSEAASTTGVFNDMGCDFGEGVMSLEEILRELPSFVKVQEAHPWKNEVNVDDCLKS